MVNNIARWAGTLLVIISLIYVFNSLSALSEDIQILENDPKIISLILLISLIYGASQFLLSEAWLQILSVLGTNNLNRQTIYQIYGKTQLAKYLPGNVFHYAGRIALAKKTGVHLHHAIPSLVIEVFGLVSGALILTCFLVNQIYQALQLELFRLPLLIAFCIVLVIVFIAYKKYCGRINQKLFLQLLTKKFHLLSILFLYLFFFLISGLILLVMLQWFNQSLDTITPFEIIGISCAAWITGYITPGAPGGIGIREATLVLMLTPVSGPVLSALIAVIIRIISVLGDIFFWLFTVLNAKRSVLKTPV
jgi:hypothetical protein